MKYHVVFDVLQVGYRNWWLAAVGLFFLAGGVSLLIKQRKGTARVGWFLPVWTIAFSLLWIVWTSCSTYGEYAKVRDALITGRYTVVEGKVSQFVPMPSNGHGHESFVVGGRRYEYSQYGVSTGFNQTRSDGGPIRDGLRVRIAEVDGRFDRIIARLEVAE